MAYNCCVVVICNTNTLVTIDNTKKCHRLKIYYPSGVGQDAHYYGARRPRGRFFYLSHVHKKCCQLSVQNRASSRQHVATEESVCVWKALVTHIIRTRQAVCVGVSRQVGVRDNVTCCQGCPYGRVLVHTDGVGSLVEAWRRSCDITTW